MNHEEYLRTIEEVNKLRTEIHLFNEENISESALDDLKRKISVYEQENPSKISSNSPNHIVAGGVLPGFQKVTLARRLLSLQDIFSKKELQEWEERWKKVTVTEPEKPVQYMVEPKLDGMAIVLYYSNGLLKQASTRGDSRIGEDITQITPYIRSIPKVIEDKRSIEVRGELIMTFTDFKQLNDDISKGLKKGKQGKTGADAIFANTRNVVAGTVRNLDVSIIQERNVQFIAYGLFIDESA
jgi:DNA ligase (NAD+)